VIHRTTRGSAPLEFVGVGALTTLVVLAILQVAVVSHVRAVVLDSAAAGAAHGALADSSLRAAVERTRSLLKIGIASDLISKVSGSTGTVASRRVAVIRVDYRVPAFAMWIPTAIGSVSARAFVEVP
jgi:hypothetical protein